jgi:hypothetical protein
MQHIEPAGVHSGDSTAVIPTYSLSKQVIQKIEEYQFKIAKTMDIIGFLNVQYAVKNEVPFTFLRPIQDHPNHSISGQSHGAARSKNRCQSDARGQAERVRPGHLN